MLATNPASFAPEPRPAWSLASPSIAKTSVTSRPREADPTCGLPMTPNVPAAAAPSTTTNPTTTTRPRERCAGAGAATAVGPTMSGTWGRDDGGPATTATPRELSPSVGALDGGA